MGEKKIKFVILWVWYESWNTVYNNRQKDTFSIVIILMIGQYVPFFEGFVACDVLHNLWLFKHLFPLKEGWKKIIL